MRGTTHRMEKTEIELSSSALTLPGSYQDWKPEADNCYKIVSGVGRDFKYTGTIIFRPTQSLSFMMPVRGLVWLAM